MGFYKPHFVAIRKSDPFQNLKKLAKVLQPLKGTFKPLFCKSFPLCPGKYGKEKKTSFFSVIPRISLENSKNFSLLFEKVWSINQPE